MKDCFYQYRKGLYDVLSTLTYKGDLIPVVEFAEAEQATPYIQILNMSSSYERDDDVFMQQVTTDIMVVTDFVGDAGKFGSMESDTIMNSVMELLITKGVTPADRVKHIAMADFTDCGCFFQGLNYQPTFDGVRTVICKILTIRTSIDEN
jgi:ribosomal protein L37AE/L43A